MDNYPPGVSGNEDEFGPQEEEEFEAVHTCEVCGHVSEVLVVRQTYSSGTVEYWDCPRCFHNHETNFDPVDSENN